MRAAEVPLISGADRKTRPSLAGGRETSTPHRTRKAPGQDGDLRPATGGSPRITDTQLNGRPRRADDESGDAEGGQCLAAAFNAMLEGCGSGGGPESDAAIARTSERG